jgi:hypothetical protein
MAHLPFSLFERTDANQPLDNSMARPASQFPLQSTLTGLPPGRVSSGVLLLVYARYPYAGVTPRNPALARRVQALS